MSINFQTTKWLKKYVGIKMLLNCDILSNDSFMERCASWDVNISKWLILPMILKCQIAHYRT